MKLLRHMKISRKLTISFLIVSLITTAVAGVGIYGLSMSKATENSIYERRIASLPVITKVLTSLTNIQALSQNALLNNKDLGTFSNDRQKFDENVELVNKNHATLMKDIKNDEWRKKLTEAKKLFNSTYQPQVKQAFQLAEAGNVAQANTTLKILRTTQNDINTVYNGFMDYRVQMAQQETAAASQLITVMLLVLIAVSVVGIALSVALGLLISRSISVPLNLVKNAAAEFEQGSLQAAVDYDSRNEFGMAAHSLNVAFQKTQDVIIEISGILNDMANGDYSKAEIREYGGDFKQISDAANTILDNLNRTFTTVLNSADQVDSGARQVSDGAQSLAQGATEQASSVQELSASITEVSSKIQGNAKQIRHISDVMGGTTSEAEQGNSRMEQLLSAMNEISVSSNEIGKIIQVIDDIAFQTNILALNASVEAARAGQAGKGFAVVAEEVRNLAGKSADAAKQTALLIGNSSEKVKEGLTLADDTGKVLSDMVQRVSGINQAVRQIEQASEAQSNSVGQITQGVEQISAVVQTNSATAEESAAASEELSAQADLLKNELSWVRLRKEGGQTEAEI